MKSQNIRTLLASQPDCWLSFHCQYIDRTVYVVVMGGRSTEPSCDAHLKISYSPDRGIVQGVFLLSNGFSNLWLMQGTKEAGTGIQSDKHVFRRAPSAGILWGTPYHKTCPIMDQLILSKLAE